MAGRYTHDAYIKMTNAAYKNDNIEQSLIAGLIQRANFDIESGINK